MTVRSAFKEKKKDYLRIVRMKSKVMAGFCLTFVWVTLCAGCAILIYGRKPHHRSGLHANVSVRQHGLYNFVCQKGQSLTFHINILPPYCNHMLIFGKRPFFIMYFQNVSVNPIIS